MNGLLCIKISRFTISILYLNMQVALQGSVANFLKRMGHTMSAMTLGCGYSWIVLVGGVSQWDRSKPEHAQPFCSSRIFKIVLELGKSKLPTVYAHDNLNLFCL